MRFDLIDLRLFCDVVDEGSITAGAEKSALALAAASTRVRNMELALGAALLTRSRQGVALTPAGRMLLKHARTILGQTARMREDLSTFAGGLSGEVRLLANTNALTEFLPEVLSSFLAAHPHVSVDLEERLSDEIVGLIAEGVGDVGIVAGTVDVGTLQTYPFRSDRFVVVTPPGHPLTARPAATFAEVLAYDFVGLERSSSLQRFLTAKAAREGRPLRARIQLRSFDAVCRMVEAGVGVGVVPQTTAARAAKAMSLAITDLADDWALRELTIVVRADDELRPYARELVESLRA
ncbi:MAG: LysR family transcriptional regulator [Alphaproteobacteria bacterium]|nr:LysR family transcriptional regulator [Alphaproteobacteria bacterium]MBU1514708.1 LysR family transcriptional regulator [Alphaproteobacteria bacterium]MBU2093567.1 LysR family transcriptional regulator [Alphaproteobacteria bacterium]MBU2149481.1 LysR family transcriptional regulator [Alphaproteobacteria bacterium]MBU2305476.1 LysR family transcriptional regulator [Alphaproteobacteria bacterium]